jgi:hypothetical protein
MRNGRWLAEGVIRLFIVGERRITLSLIRLTGLFTDVDSSYWATSEINVLATAVEHLSDYMLIRRPGSRAESREFTNSIDMPN